MEPNHNIKSKLIEVLDFFKYQIVNDKCTPETMQSIFNTIEENIIAQSNVNSIADFYKQKESNVRSVISRNIMPKPKRTVLYNFIKFLRIKPKSWHS
jgi:hypothetical protein